MSSGEGALKKSSFVPGARTTEQVLRDEAKSIHNVDLTQTDEALYDARFGLKSAALCLSGGGIRSAAFALGVIQALAVHPRPLKDDKARFITEHDPGEIDRGGRVDKPGDSLLARFHYLSTVSGGGYIGSWLSAWVTRAGFPVVWQNLIGRPQGSDIEPPAIAWLRAYSNYLTPKLGIRSADSWAAVALVLRNLLLNWLVILPVLCLVVLFLKLFAVAIVWFSELNPYQCGISLIPFFAGGCACLVLGLSFINRNRPTPGAGNAGQTAFLCLCFVPTVLSAILFSFAVASTCVPVTIYTLPVFSSLPPVLATFVFGMTVGVVLYAASWLLPLPWMRVGRRGSGWNDLATDGLSWIVAGAVYGALMALGIQLYVQSYGGFWFFTPAQTLLVVFGVPWAVTSQLIASMIFVALSSGEKDSDADREWLGRADGWFMVLALGWAVLMFLVFVGSRLAEQLYDDYRVWATGAGAGAVTAWLGKSSATPARGPARKPRGISADVVLAAAAPVFAGARIIVTSALLDDGLFGQPLTETDAFNAPMSEGWPDWPAGWSLPIAIAVALALAAIASRCISVNRFSLHAM